MVVLGGEKRRKTLFFFLKEVFVACFFAIKFAVLVYLAIVPDNSVS